MPEFAISRNDVCAAAERLSDKILHTPCLLNERLSQQYGCHVYFKAESLQHVGAFKARGALNAVLQLTETEAAAGVVTHSSGNHATALARAATLRGIRAHIVMPENAPRNKIEAVRGYGIEPIFCEPTVNAREAAAADIQRQHGAVLIHPFDHPAVMAGQGTVGLEIQQQVPSVDAVICPVGGGGLLSGILTAFSNTQTPVFAAEPAWADDTYRSLRSGQIEPPLRYDSIADGLRTSLGRYTFPIIQSRVQEVLLVSEDAIRRALRSICETAKLVCEPSGAVGFAVMDQYRERFAGKTVVFVVTGGNLDMGACQLGRSAERA